MIYRPKPEHRKNIQGVAIPLTAAIHQVFGSRAQDGARPLGAFYTENIDARVWQHLGGIWYRPLNEEMVARRIVKAIALLAFARSILSGEAVVLPSGMVVGWEAVPLPEACQLPPPLVSGSDA